MDMIGKTVSQKNTVLESLLEKTISYDFVTGNALYVFLIFQILLGSVESTFQYQRINLNVCYQFRKKL